jgi:hypothetical protein
MRKSPKLALNRKNAKTTSTNLKLRMKTMQYTDQQLRFYANPANGLPPEAQKFMEETTPLTRFPHPNA